MRTRKNVVVVFSKIPEPGKVKTRLTFERGGIMSPEAASGLFHCMLFDVVEITCAALQQLEERLPVVDAQGQEVRDVYELVVSTTPSGNRAVMEELFERAGQWPRWLVFDFDEGATFDAHYNQAFEKAWARGADAVVSFGADMPALMVSDVAGAFDALHAFDSLRDCPEIPTPSHAPSGGIVLAPDQQMGVSLVGWTRDTAFNHDGVFYHPEGLTVLPAYIAKARENGLPVRMLPAIPDVDTVDDLMHAATLAEALCYAAPFDGNTPPWRTAQALEEMGLAHPRVAPNNLIDPRGHIDR